jgi:hypothetical protein
MSDKHTLSSLLAELGVDISNMQEFLNKLSQILSTNSDTVTISQTLQDGRVVTHLVPSFGYLSGKIDNVEAKFNALLSANGNEVGVRDENGVLKKFELKDVSTIVSQLNQVATISIAAPSQFGYKENWFFESFLNPLIFVKSDVSALLANDVDKFEVKRIILTSNSTAATTFFDQTYKGQTDISETQLIADFVTRGFSYFEDTNIIDLPPAVNSVRGSFDVIKILEDTQAELISGETLSRSIRKYKLNSIRYNQTVGTTTVERTLEPGDIVITADGSEYQIDSVDKKLRTVILNRIFGEGAISQGANVLNLKPVLVVSPELQVNVGYNEREVIFVKPISTRLGVTTEEYSRGFGIFTNELTISLNNGTTMPLSEFYVKFVSDFGLLFLNYAKEKKLPNSLGEVPNSPTLAAANFKVVQIDQHIKNADNTDQIKQKISAKEQLSSQIKETDQQISRVKANLNTNASLNESQRLSLQKELQSLSDTRSSATTNLSSVVKEITTSIKTTPQFIADSKYRVRGFWEIPAAKITEHGTQEVVQFKVSYRYLSKTGTSQTADALDFVDSTGSKKTGYFSPYTEILTKARTKVLNELTGFYEWIEENVADADAVNSNQLDIPIRKGESVEIRIKAVSEAGWPDNPIESEWSAPILVEFPQNIESGEEATILAQQVFAEETRITFQDELNSKGLDIHLGSAFTTRDKYFAHKAEDVASGFFGTDGSIIDLYVKLKSLTDELSALKASISSVSGELVVKIIEPNANEISIANGQTVNIFAGYYKELIKNTSSQTTTYDHGKILANSYNLQLSNTSQTPLELISYLTGGIGEEAQASNPATTVDSNYNSNLRYDKVPLMIDNAVSGEISGFAQIEGYQSSQVRSQYIYNRYKNITIKNSLYAGQSQTPSTVSYPNVDTQYNYQGVSIAGSLLPYREGHYLPFDPTWANASWSTNANVWNGTVTAGVGVGGGKLSEFCIHKDHPDAAVAWSIASQRPSYTVAEVTADVQKTLRFSQAIHCETSVEEATNKFGAKYWQQAERVTPASATIVAGAIPAANTRERQYPIKLGFGAGDEFLIGKYTCGSYLYMSPSSYETVSTTSLNPVGAKRTLEFGTTKAINIPIVYQFRCSDKLGFIGGFRLGSNLKNIKYSKTMGIDIYLKNDVFSFDVTVSAQYAKETTVIASVVLRDQEAQAQTSNNNVNA